MIGLEMPLGENGIFDHSKCRYAARIIRAEIEQLQESYSHSKLVAALGFGFWRYLFSPHQYRAGGQTLLQVFSQKPKSSRLQHFNASFIFEQLTKIHQIRNRIAHHEPICFLPSTPKRDTYYVRSHYAIIIKLFRWMDINETALLYGIDHVLKHCHEVDDI